MSSTSSSLKTASELVCSSNSSKRSLVLYLCFYGCSSQRCGTNVMPLTRIHAFVRSRPTSPELDGRKGSKKPLQAGLVTSRTGKQLYILQSELVLPLKLLWRLPQQNPPAGQRQETFLTPRASASVQHWGLQLGNDMFLLDKVILGAAWVNLIGKG